MRKINHWTQLIMNSILSTFLDFYTFTPVFSVCADSESYILNQIFQLVFSYKFTQFKHFVGLGRRGVRRMKGGGLYIVRKKENFIGFFVMRICWHWRGWEESEWSQKEKWEHSSVERKALLLLVEDILQCWGTVSNSIALA